jgi:S1-C subfamily serine protease
MSSLDELAETINSVAQKVGPATVRVGGGWRGGSGVVVGDGLVLTNAHNVRHERVTVTFGDGRQEEAEVKGIDVDGDLAVLAAATGGVAPLNWAAAAPGLGTPVFGVANSGSAARVTFGTVSSVSAAFRGPRGRRIAGTIEHTAPLAPGSSGGPLVNAAGELVGINTNRLGDAFYLALPADAALRDRVAGLQSGKSVERPRLGVGIAPAHVARRLRRSVGLPERDGLLVREVEDDSPAAKAGVREGDLIVAAGGRDIASADDLFDALGAAGASLTLGLVRGAEDLTLEVALA